MSAERLVIGTVAQSVSSWVLYAGLDRGLFAQAGVVAELRTMHNSVAHMDALLDGGIDIGDQLADHIIRAAANGADLAAILGVDRPDAHLVVESSIDGFDRLRGRTIAVDGLRTGYALVLLRMLRTHDLDPAIDVSLVSFGGTHQRFEALIDGRIAATLLDPPYRFAASAQGMGSLGRTSDVVRGYQGTVQACSQAWAANHANLLIRYVRGYVLAWDWLHNTKNRGEAIDLLARRLALPVAIASDTYDEHILAGRFNRHGTLRSRDLLAVLQLMNDVGENVEEAVLERCCDSSYAERGGAFD